MRKKVCLFATIITLCLVSFLIGRWATLPVEAASNSSAAPEQSLPDTPTTPISPPAQTITPPTNSTSTENGSPKEVPSEEPPELSLAEKNQLVAAEYPDLPLDALGEKYSYEYKIFRITKADSTFVCFTNEKTIYQYRDKGLLQTWSDFFFRYGDEVIDVSSCRDDEPQICIINQHENHVRYQIIELRSDGTFGPLYNLAWVELDRDYLYNDLRGLLIEDNTLYSFTREKGTVQTEKILDDVVDAGYGGPFLVVDKTDGISYMKLHSSYYGEYDDSINRYLVLGDSEYWTPAKVASSWRLYSNPGSNYYPTTSEFTWVIKGEQAEFVEFD